MILTASEYRKKHLLNKWSLTDTDLDNFVESYAKYYAKELIEEALSEQRIESKYPDLQHLSIDDCHNDSCRMGIEWARNKVLERINKKG